MFLFLFLVSCNNDLFMPVLIINIKVKEAPAIPTGTPTAVDVKLHLMYQMMLIK